MNQQHTFALEFLELLPLADFQSIIDVGAGPGYQAQWFLDQGKDAVAIDVVQPTVSVPYMYGDMTDRLPVNDGAMDAVWSHHALEHVLNPMAALFEFHRVIRDGGWLFLTVPQIDTTISNGHIVSFNMPLLVYQLALAGFNVANGYMGKFRSHLRCAVRNTHRDSMHPWDISISDMSAQGMLPASVESFVSETGRFNGASLTTTWLDGSLHYYE